MDHGAVFVRAQVVDGKLRCGEAEFTWLYVDAQWIDAAALADLLRLARQGLPICLAQQPRQPGRVKAAAYDQQVMKLAALPNVTADYRKAAVNPPLAEGDDLPDFWCTVNEKEYTFFFAIRRRGRFVIP